MDTVTLLIYAVAAVGLLVVIGWILSLIAIGKAARVQKEIKHIYGQESEIKKRIEQYISKKASDELGKAVEGYREGLDLQSREVVKQMEEATKTHMDSLAKFILQQEALITKQAEYIVGALVKSAQSDIETYKKNQMEGIDETVAAIVEKIAPEVIGKSISMEDHAELVWKALERAKKEGLFVKGISGSVSPKTSESESQKTSGPVNTESLNHRITEAPTHRLTEKTKALRVAMPAGRQGGNPSRTATKIKKGKKK